VFYPTLQQISKQVRRKQRRLVLWILQAFWTPLQINAAKRLQDLSTMV